MPCVSCVEDTNAVVNGEPFQVTCVPGIDAAEASPKANPDPFTVSVKPELPATTTLGERLVKVSED